MIVYQVSQTIETTEIEDHLSLTSLTTRSEHTLALGIGQLHLTNQL
jgi:hypothetical protein